VDNHTVNGFYFEDAAMAAKAEKEAETVRYIRSKTNLARVDAVYGIYTKLIENNVFSTEVGYSFLMELYWILQESGTYNASDLPKVYISKGHVSESKTVSDKQSDEAEMLSDEDEARIVEAVRKRTKSLNDTSKTQVRNIRAMYKDKLKTYKMVIWVLVLCIIGMLALVYFSDASPLRDAEQQVLDKYATWQETLQEKEERLREKEAALSAWEKELKEKEASLASWEKKPEEKEGQLSGQ